TRCWRLQMRHRSIMHRWRPVRPPSRSLSLRRRCFLAVAMLLPLADARRLTAPRTEIVELGTADLAATNDFDRVDHRGVQRKYALDALTIRDFPHRKILVEALPRAPDAHALIGLHAGALALDHLDVHEHGIARCKVRNVLAGRQLCDLLLLELLD